MITRYNLFAIQILLNLGAVVADCRDGWMAFRGSCYLFTNVPESWSESQFFCFTLGAHLVEIETEVENNFIITTLEGLHANDPNKVNVHYWIGATDIEVEGIFRWSTSREELTYTHWGGQPSNSHGEEDCVELAAGGHFTWNDLPCENRVFFICEMNSTRVIKNVNILG